ncbi:hypothetical protein BDV23DRAFT_183024 [Aspergillus alliaceus]|uniref:WAP domain-containing protein n=1 Tax=Petromyces alliaceus TaxID=209559 RepID=A0A5N7C9W7_PETAA|nr:hypothetical protein BDV23DRAFT_183024 [Aspergillus alliaceus]
MKIFSILLLFVTFVASVPTPKPNDAIDISNLYKKREAATPLQTCNWATECSPGYLCCGGYCQNVYDCRRVPPKQPPQQLPEEPDQDEDGEDTPETLEEPKLNKRRYRSPKNEPDEKPAIKPSEETDQSCTHAWECGVTGEHQWACCNGKCLKWYPGPTPWIRPKCMKMMRRR